MNSLASLVAPEPVKSDLLRKKVSESRQHSPPASPGPQLSLSSSSSTSSSVTDYSPPSPSSPSASTMDPPSPKAKPTTTTEAANTNSNANSNNNNNNNFNVFIGRHQVSVVVLKHQGIGGKHPRDAGKFYYQARIRNEYPQRHIWSGWANREEVVQKISALLKATPDTKIETVPTQNPSKRQNNDSASASTRRQSVKRRQPSSNSVIKAETSVSRRKASRGDDLADIAERMQKRARGAAATPTASPPAATSAMNLQPQAANSFPTTAPLQFSNLAYFAHVPHLYYPVYPQASTPAVGAAGAAQNMATFQLLSLAAANVPYPHLQYPTLVPVAVESNPLAPTATPTAVPLTSPVASPATAATPPVPTSPTIRNSEMESLVILAGLERQQLDRAE